MDLHASGQLKHYVDESKEVSGKFDAGFASVIDVLKDLKIVSFGGYRYGKEQRGEGELPLSGPLPRDIEPASYHDFVGGSSITKHFNRLWVQFGGDYGYTNYDSGALPSLSGLTRDTRTGSRIEGLGKLGYEILPNTSIFVEGRVNERFHKDAFDAAGNVIDFDSNGYKMLGGLFYELTNLTRAEFGLGYMEQTCRFSGVQDLSTWTYRGAVKWEMTPFVLLQFTANRDLGGPSFAARLSTRVDSEVAARADYAIRRDVILSAVLGLVLRALSVHTAMRNCTGDGGRPSGFGDQVADPKPP